MLYSGVILKQATTALRLCLDNNLCQTIFLDLNGCSVCRTNSRQSNSQEFQPYSEHTEGKKHCFYSPLQGGRGRQKPPAPSWRPSLAHQHLQPSRPFPCKEPSASAWMGCPPFHNARTQNFMKRILNDHACITNPIDWYKYCTAWSELTDTFPWGWRLFCRNSLTSSSVSLCKVKKYHQSLCLDLFLRCWIVFYRMQIRPNQNICNSKTEKIPRSIGSWPSWSAPDRRGSTCWGLLGASFSRRPQ